MMGYTLDEKLRLQQLQALRRQWLKDQELSPWEPVLPPEKMWPMEKFWNKFLVNKIPWRNMVYKENVWTLIMGTQSSNAFQGDLISKEAEVASPVKAKGQENGHRNHKEGEGDSSASSPTKEEQEQGEICTCSKGTAQEGKVTATPKSQESQAKGAEASAASEEAEPQATEPSTP
ncbi:hypothetical protein P7K49_033762 [Saguinus oedipus]|uniref:NADH dehydrogenase [ubiquinone] 1 beta subcomplex subunit 6 n=1 Tax=Saguinus oedipus TaxID=9490 RepID=A0ABQ9TTR0_SAGOE|nr:hypothetical protein P7K49_033762 [Saguinus oedipus]